MLSWLHKRRQRHGVATQLYNALVAHARDPQFYRAYGVPDSMLGRFEMICLHAFFLFRRLGKTDNKGRELSQTVHDLMFADFDRTLREQGVGDMGIGKRIKKLAKNLYGRLDAYDTGLASGPSELNAALKRNLYASASASEDEVTAMIAYINAAIDYLDKQSTADIMAGQVAFPAPAAGPGASAGEARGLSA